MCNLCWCIVFNIAVCVQDESERSCGVNECERNNGGCQHQCIDTEDAYNCQCNDGFRLIGKYTCEGMPLRLYVSHLHDIVN